MSAGELLRAPLFHTPRNPFFHERALECRTDGGLLIRDGRIVDSGDYQTLRAAHPLAENRDLRGGFILPALIDTHTHYPQMRILGGFGGSLLDWLERRALPEEARMAEEVYARQAAGHFVDALVSHGTATAMVFGAHFAPATAALFEAAQARGIRLISGMVLSDRFLRPELHQKPDAAYRASIELIRCFHGRGRLLYAVTPRFALSASEAMLEICQTLLREHPSLRFQTHLNENPREIAEVMRVFPWAKDYLAVYQRFDLIGAGSVLAHSVHTTQAEMERLASSGASIAHCPSSNAALGSGIFPMRRHIENKVPFALGTDVGAGISFSILREALQSYLIQRVAPEELILRPAHLLYLATRAGAGALGLHEDTGDFQSGKSADLLYLRPPANSPLASALERAGNEQDILAALLALAGQESVAEVLVGGQVVYRR